MCEKPDLTSGPSPIPGAVAAGKTSRLAIASLVCGVFGFFCLPALVGLALGLIALVQINKSQGRLGGQGLAIAGVCVSGLMLMLIFPAMLLPALAKAKAKAMRIQCGGQMKQIGFAASLHADVNKGAYPRDFVSMRRELGSPAMLCCPADKKHMAARSWDEFDPNKHLSYELLKPGIKDHRATHESICRCPIHNNVLLGDGSVLLLAPARQ